jgi:ribosome-binding factor A
MSRQVRSEPSQRQLRVGEQLRHVIAETMQRGHFRDEELSSGCVSVTVTEVSVSPDLKHATAYVMSLGGIDLEHILNSLNEEHQVFQREINRQLNLKFTPKVKFRSDNSYDNAQKIEDIISNIHYSENNDDTPSNEG